MNRCALVLGAGGYAAMAWETGFITGMAEKGLDVRSADLVVGTSAGSRVAAQIGSGLPLDELFRQLIDPSLHTDESAPSIDFKRWHSEVMRAKNESADAREFLRQAGSMTGAVVSAAERQKMIASWLPEKTWPKQRIELVAVDADQGERHVFEAASGVPLVDAVAASGALAGIYPAITISDRRYIDGGFYSTDNADLAVGFDRVLILTLQAGNPPLCVVSLEAAVDKLRSAGARVEVVHPDEATTAAFASVGGNILDPAIRGSAARAGREQGRNQGATLAAFWQWQSGEIHERAAAPL